MWWLLLLDLCGFVLGVSGVGIIAVDLLYV